MSTTKKTSSSQQNVFDPTSMGQYHDMSGAGTSAISDEIRNPYGSMFFNQQLQMMRRQQGQSQLSGQQSLQQRAQAMGINPNSPQYFSQMNRLQRQGQGDTSRGYGNLLLNAANLRQGAIGQAMNFRPLQTGQTGQQSETTGGLGTWLPQVAGMGLSALTMGMGGGAGGFASMAHLGQGAQTQSGDMNNPLLQPTSYQAPNPWQ
jgi:hypothetical protein